MSLLKKLSKKEQEQLQDHGVYATMGAVGVSPEHMKSYQDSVAKIRAFERRQTDSEQQEPQINLTQPEQTRIEVRKTTIKCFECKTKETVIPSDKPLLMGKLISQALLMGYSWVGNGDGSYHFACGDCFKKHITPNKNT